MTQLIRKFIVGDTVVLFEAPVGGKGAPQLSLLPRGLKPVKDSEFLPSDVEIRGLPASCKPRRAWALDSLVQLKCREDNYGESFSQGRTMRAGHSTTALEFIGQKIHKKMGPPPLSPLSNTPRGCAASITFSGSATRRFSPAGSACAMREKNRSPSRCSAASRSAA